MVPMRPLTMRQKAPQLVPRPPRQSRQMVALIRRLKALSRYSMQHSQQDSLTPCMDDGARPLTGCNNQSTCSSLGCLPYVLRK